MVQFAAHRSYLPSLQEWPSGPRSTEYQGSGNLGWPSWVLEGMSTSSCIIWIGGQTVCLVINWWDLFGKIWPQTFCLVIGWQDLSEGCRAGLSLWHQLGQHAFGWDWRCCHERIWSLAWCLQGMVIKVTCTSFCSRDERVGWCVCKPFNSGHCWNDYFFLSF